MDTLAPLPRLWRHRCSLLSAYSHSPLLTHSTGKLIHVGANRSVTFLAVLSPPGPPPLIPCTSSQYAVYLSDPEDVIQMDSGLYGGTGRNSRITIRHPLTIIGAGAQRTIIDANFTSRHFEVKSVRLTLRNMTLMHGKVGPLTPMQGECSG